MPYNRNYTRRCRFENSRMNEAVEDPRELLLSLVDLGSIDADDMLLACVQEMSDAECKRVLNTVQLPSCCDNVESEDDFDDSPVADEIIEPEDEEDDEMMDGEDEDVEMNDSDDEEDADADESVKRRKELEARLARLERRLASCSK